MPHIEFLATELLVHIFSSLDTIEDVLALSSTCRRMHSIYASTQQLPLLTLAAERQHGPLSDAIQLVTHNESQPPLAARSAAPSLALLAQIARVGAVANRWADIYPFKKWRVDFLERRALSPAERARVRRAVYRLWLFAAAFHAPPSPFRDRHGAAPPPNARAAEARRRRAELLRHWPAHELLEMADVRAVLRDAIAHNVCPSNAAVARKFHARHEGDADAAPGGLVFNLVPPGFGTGIISYGGSGCFAPPRVMTVYDNERDYDLHGGMPGRRGDDGWVGGLPTPPDDDDGPFHRSGTYRAQQHSKTWAMSLGRRGAGAEAGAEGWGDEVAHGYAVDDMLKLDPGAILWLKERKMRRADVLRWLAGLGEWFETCRDTCGETLEEVLEERDVLDIEEALEMGGGVVADDEEE